jgi:hypothetical protein
MCISTMIIISCPCTISLWSCGHHSLPRTPSSHVLLMPNSQHLTHGISNLVSLITKTKLGLSTAWSSGGSLSGFGDCSRLRSIYCEGFLCLFLAEDSRKATLVESWPIRVPSWVVFAAPSSGLGIWGQLAREPSSCDSPQCGRRLPASNRTMGINLDLHIVIICLWPRFGSQSSITSTYFHSFTC